jgi:hypothetical protein
MASGEYVLKSLTEMDRYVRLMGRMTHASGILECVRTYLWSWSPERVASLQKIDGGWAPFDHLQQPIGVYSAADVHRISTALRSQCKALDASQIELTPDILELDLFLFLAGQLLDCLQDDARMDKPQTHPSVRPFY